MDEPAAGWNEGVASIDDHDDFGRLRRVPLFHGLNDTSLRALVTDAQVRRVDNGTVLFVQDDDADRFYVLLDGWVKLYRLTEEGAQALVTVVAPGETFAEAAVFANAPFPVCAEAVGPATILVLYRRVFAGALAADPQIALIMLGSLSMRLRHLVERIEQLQVKSAPRRLADFIVRLCPESSGPTAVELPFAKVLVAQRLGRRPETLSRALAALRTEGVRATGRHVAISDIGRLRAYCRMP
jgi:CRP-like cAMP-binding protein